MTINGHGAFMLKMSSLDYSQRHYHKCCCSDVPGMKTANTAHPVNPSLVYEDTKEMGVTTLNKGILLFLFTRYIQ